MSKILYDLEIATEESSRGGQRVTIVVATVRRYDLDPATKTVEPIQEPATRVSRAISHLSLAAVHYPDDVMEAERNATMDEAMRVATRRGPAEDPLRVSPEKRLGVLGPNPSREDDDIADYLPVVGCVVCGKVDEWVNGDGGPCRRCSSVGRVEAMGKMTAASAKTVLLVRLRSKYPDLREDQLKALLASLPLVDRLATCPVCLEPNSAVPGSPCPECLDRKKVNRPLVRPPASPATPAITIQGPPCPNCGGTKGWMPGRDECPDCGWDGVTCATDECFALVAAGDSLCPKCVKEGGEWADRVAAGAEDGGRTVFCPDCGRLFHSCAADPACPNCNHDPTQKAGKGTCSECNGTGLSEAGGLCPMCKDLLRKKDDDDWADLLTESPAAVTVTKKNEPCPECGGTGEVQLFTSVAPCSRGCKKR